MRQGDIKIGTEYAVAMDDYAYREGYADRARVIGEEGVPHKYGGQVPGHRVRYLRKDGYFLREGDSGEPRERVVRNRCIREEWSTYEERWRRIRAKRRQNVLVAQRAAADRAALLRDIIPALREAGIEDEAGYCYNEETVGLIRQATPEIFDSANDRHYHAPLAGSYADFVRGDLPFRVGVDILLTLLAPRD